VKKDCTKRVQPRFTVMGTLDRCYSLALQDKGVSQRFHSEYADLVLQQDRI